MRDEVAFRVALLFCPIVVSLKPFLTPRRLTAGVLALGAVGLTAAGVTLYLQREAIGVRLAFDYLRAHGVPAAIHLDRLDLGGVTGSVRLGPADHPDLTVGRLQADFGALPAPWRGVRAPPLRALHLDQAVLHARLRDGRLDFGTLQPLIDQALQAKPGAGPAPDLYIQDGRLELDTPGGPVSIALDATVKGGRVRTLHARLEPGDLDLMGVRLADVQGVLSGQATGLGELHLTGAFGAARGRSPQGAATGLTLNLEALTPNGAADLTQGDRPVDAIIRLSSSRFELQPDHGAAVEVQGADVSADLNGEMDRTNAFIGKLHVSGRAGRLARAGVELASVGMELASPQVLAQVEKAGVVGGGPFELSLSARSGRLHEDAGATQVGGLDILLTPASLRARGQLGLAQGVTLQAQGTLAGGGGLPRRQAEHIAQRALGELDPGAARALAQTLQQVRLDVPAYALAYDSRRDATLRLDRGAELATPGGRLSLHTSSGEPLVSTNASGATGNGLALALVVEGLPRISLAVGRYRVGRDGAAWLGGLTLSAHGGLGPVQDASLDFAGALSGRSARWTLAASDCAPVSVGSLKSKGQVVASGGRVRVCPVAGGPLASLDDGRWRLNVQLRDAAVALPSASLKLQLASAPIALEGGPQPPSGRMGLEGLAVQDTSTVARVRPLAADGTLTLADGAVQGRLAVALVKGAAPLGVLSLQAQPSRGTGQGVFQTGRLVFAPKGLQPGDIVPAAAQALPDAQGELQLSARFAWSRAGLSSSGQASSDGFSFKSPAGKIDGLRGDVRLASLTPLRSPPGQTLTADKLETLAPLKNIKVVFALEPSAMALQTASAGVSGGEISLDAMRLPLAPPLQTSGVLRLKDVDVQQLISLLNLSKAVSLQARLQGALPFALRPGPGGGTLLRISDGRVAAEGPGRLTIRREALTGAVATGGAPAAQPNAVQDFAYQALEHLAFSQLDAEVASRPGGRLGVVFHVIGRHDPAINKPTRIGLWALLRGHAFDKPLPLPKGTPVDLTLDTSLNLDDILAAYGWIGGEHTPAMGSPKVQP